MGKFGDGPHQKLWLTGLLCLVLGISISGCHRSIKAVNVSSQDILRSNEVAGEGDIAFARKDLYTALIKYLEAVRLNPKNEYVYNKLGITYSQLAALTGPKKGAADLLAQRKYYEQAETALLRSIQLNPKYPFSYNNLGSVYYAQSRFKKAEKNFKKAISLQEKEASFHMNMSALYLVKKKKDKARAEWQRAVALDPNVLKKNVTVSLWSDQATMAERQYFMACMSASQGDAESAIKHLEQAINSGFTNMDSVRKEPDFDGIRKDKRFMEFMENSALLIRLRSKIGLPEEPRR